MRNPRVAFRYCSRLLGKARSGNIALHIASEAYTSLLNDLLAAVVDPCEDMVSQYPSQASKNEVEHDVTPVSERYPAAELAGFYADLLELGMNEATTMLTNKLAAATELIHPSLIAGALGPYLQSLPQVVLDRRFELGRDGDLRLDKVAHHELCKVVASQLKQRYVGEEPRRPKISRGPKGCDAQGCENCRKLDDFLGDPDQHILNMGLHSKTDFKHLHDQMGGREYWRQSLDGIRMKGQIQQKPYYFRFEKLCEEWDLEVKRWKERTRRAEEALQGTGVNLSDAPFPTGQTASGSTDCKSGNLARNSIKRALEDREDASPLKKRARANVIDLCGSA